jgi:hypothetical protein
MWRDEYRVDAKSNLFEGTIISMLQYSIFLVLDWIHIRQFSNPSDFPDKVHVIFSCSAVYLVTSRLN